MDYERRSYDRHESSDLQRNFEFDFDNIYNICAFNDAKKYWEEFYGQNAISNKGVGHEY